MQSLLKFEKFNDYSPEKFIVSGSNRLAYNFIKSEPWPFYAVNIYGPLGSGKTHLAHIAKAEIIRDFTDEKALLAKLNTSREENKKIILISETPLSQEKINLPDLKSRINAIPAIAIEKPDDELFQQLIISQFATRQLTVVDDVVKYLLARLERSSNAIAEAVEKIDRQALTEHRNITIPLVKSVIE